MSVDPIGVVIITYRAREHLRVLLPALQSSTVPVKILVVNSSSHDGTVEEAQKWGVDVHVVPRLQFNHGSTREEARKIIDTPIVVMMTPDAYPADAFMVERLTKPIRNECAVATYARQIPHEGADLFERFAREFHYPNTSRFYTASSSENRTETLFFSNSCSAYDQDALDQVGGFPHVLLGEDTLTAGALLQRGYSLAYVAEALVHHSHRYGALEEFMRHFDIGCMRHLLGAYGHHVKMDRKRGWEYARAFLSRVAAEEPAQLPSACLHLISKWSGYQVGKLSSWMPHALCKRLSSQKFYWDSLKKEG